MGDQSATTPERAPNGEPLYNAGELGMHDVLDPDDDALTYTASSSAPRVVAASAAGARVTLVGTGEGMGTIRVTATDPGGLSASQSFAVTVSATATGSLPRCVSPSRLPPPRGDVRADDEGCSSDPKRAEMPPLTLRLRRKHAAGWQPWSPPPSRPVSSSRRPWPPAAVSAADEPVRTVVRPRDRRSRPRRRPDALTNSAPCRLGQREA